MNDPELAANLVTRVNVGDALTRTAGRLPDKLALVDGERSWTYGALNTRVNSVAHGLAGLGYGRGDVLALASGNSAEFLVTYFACAKLGVVCVPMNLGWRADEIAYVLDHSEARGIVVEAQLVGLVEPAVEKVPTVRDVIVAYGTGADYRAGVCPTVTGSPSPTCTAPTTSKRRASPRCSSASGTRSATSTRAAPRRSPRAWSAAIVAIYLESLMVVAETGIRADERIACLMPLFHTAQLNGFATPADASSARRSTCCAASTPTRCSIRSSPSESRAPFALPMMWRALVDHPGVAARDLSSLRKCRVRDGADARRAAAAVPRHVPQCDFYLAFGQTEMSPVTTFFRPEHQLSHSGAVGTQVLERPDRDHGCGRHAAAARAGGRDRLPQPARAERLPEEPGGDRGGVPARLVPLRRRGRAGRRTACSGSATATRT